MIENNAERLKGIRNDYKKIFETEEGKRALKNIEENCFADTSVFNKEPIIMAYQCGARDVYLGIVKLMNMEIEELERLANVIQK